MTSEREAAPQSEPLRAALERLRPPGEAIYVRWSDIEAALQASPQPAEREGAE